MYKMETRNGFGVHRGKGRDLRSAKKFKDDGGDSELGFGLTARVLFATSKPLNYKYIHTYT